MAEQEVSEAAPAVTLAPQPPSSTHASAAIRSRAKRSEPWAYISYNAHPPFEIFFGRKPPTLFEVFFGRKMGGSTSKEENKGTVGEQGTHNGPEFFPVHAPSAGGGGLFTFIVIALIVGLIVLIRRARRAKKYKASRRGRGARRRWNDYDAAEMGYWSAPEDIEMMPRPIWRPPMHAMASRLPPRPAYDDGRIYEVVGSGDGAQGGPARERAEAAAAVEPEREKDRVARKVPRRVTYQEE